VILGLGIGPLRLRAPCRVVYAVREPQRLGFAYGTLAGHPESGEEAFMIQHHDDDTVSFKITAFSRPATRLAKVAGPVGGVVQRQITARYLRALGKVAGLLGPHHQEEPVSYPRLLTPEEKLADAKKLLSLPRIVVICGSTRFMTEMNEADLRETKAGKIVVKPGCDMKSPHELWSDPVEAEALKVRLDDLHRAKIRLADEVLVVGDYIGDSTRAEIAYARSLGKPVRFTHPEVDPDA
jgi:hypothetical protein